MLLSAHVSGPDSSTTPCVGKLIPLVNAKLLRRQSHQGSTLYRDRHGLGSPDFWRPRHRSMRRLVYGWSRPQRRNRLVCRLRGRSAHDCGKCYGKEIGSSGLMSAAGFLSGTGGRTPSEWDSATASSGASGIITISGESNSFIRIASTSERDCSKPLRYSRQEALWVFPRQQTVRPSSWRCALTGPTRAL
jgi:hypothetical protein